MILAGAHSGTDEIERFKTEAQAIARLQHVGIVQVFEIGEHDGLPFMALEFCGGGSLDSILAKNPLQPRAAATLVQKLAQAMHAAHEAKVIHRDLKPANVLLSDKNEPKITDFGLAKKLDEAGATRTGSVMGTPSYMPPEQANGARDIGPAADIYALGAILYECLTGRPPFRAATPLDTILQVITEEPVPLRQLNAQAPVDLETIAHKCLHKEPHKRYVSAQHLADDLGRYLNGEPIQARPVGALERALKWVRRNATVSALAGAVLVALLSGIIVSSVFGYAANEAATRATERAEAEARAKQQARDEKARADEQASVATKAKQDADERATAEANANARAQREKARAEAQLHRSELLLYAGQLAKAQREFMDGKGSVALESLETCQWNLRDIEYRFLWTRLQSRQQFITTIGPSVLSVSYTPDGKYILEGNGRTFRLLDATSGEEVRRSPKEVVGNINSVALCPSGDHIVTCASERNVQLWEMTTGREIKSRADLLDRVNSVLIHGDGVHVLIGGGMLLANGKYKGTVKVWNTQTNAIVVGPEYELPILRLACSPDGKVAAGGTYLGTIKLWNPITGKELRSLQGHFSDILGLAFSPDNTRLVSCSHDRTVRIWDVESGKELRQLSGHTFEVHCVSFNPDGTRIVTGGFDRLLKVWDVETGKELMRLQGHAGEVRSVAFSADGTRIVSGSEGNNNVAFRLGEIKVWDAENGQEGRRFLGTESTAHNGCLSPDGKYAVAVSVKNITLQNVQTREIHTLKGHTLLCGGVEFSSDGTRMVSWAAESSANAGKPGEVVVWDLVTRKPILELKGHADRVNRAIFSPDGTRIASIGHGGYEGRNKERPGELIVWDFKTGKPLWTDRSHPAEVIQIAFSPDGTRLLSAARTPYQMACLWDSDTGKQLGTFNTEYGGFAFFPDGKRMVCGFSVWDVASRREVLSLQRSGEVPRQVVVTPDGKRIIGCSFEMVHIWDPETGVELLATPGLSNDSMSLSPDGKRIVVGRASVTVWDAHRQAPTFYLKGHFEPVLSLAVSSDGKRIVSGSRDNMVKLWDATKGENLLTLKGLSLPVYSVAISADGQRIAGGSAAPLHFNKPSELKVWASATGEELLTLKGLPGGVSQIVFSPDGKRVFAWDGLSNVRAWSLESGQLVEPNNPPAKPVIPVRSPDGLIVAEPRGVDVAVTHTRLVDAKANQWPLPSQLERQRYHREQGHIAEQRMQWFAVAFHTSRLLLDDPDNADLKKRRDDALRYHAATLLEKKP